MNRIYRVVWNHALGAWQVASELAGGRCRLRSASRTARRRLGSALAATAVLATSAASADPAVFFDGVVSSGQANFSNVVTTANPTATVFSYDFALASTSSFMVSSGGLNVYVETSRNGSSNSFSAGFDNWSVGATSGWSSVVNEGFRLDFFADAAHTTSYLINAVGISVYDWGTCCTGAHTTPGDGSASGSAIYAVFDPDATQSTTMIGNITDSAQRADTDNDDQHFVAAIDDRNTFSSVVIAPNGTGEAFGAGGTLMFSVVGIGSVAAGSSVVTVGAPVVPDIDTAQSFYTTSELIAATVHAVFDGGTLAASSSGMISTNLSVKAAGGAINANGYNVTYTGVISDAGGASGNMTFTGSGSTTLDGANTYTGSTNITGGTTVNLNGSLASTSIAIASGATLNDNNGGLSGSADVTANGAFNLGANEAINTLNGTGTVGLSSNTLTVNQGAFSGAVTGSGGLTKASAGTLTLSGTNTYSGATNVNAGTLTLSGSLSSTSIAIASGATLNDNNGGLSGTADVTANGAFNLGANEAINTLNGSGTVGLNSNTLTVNQGNFSGAVAGSGGLTKASAGALTLSGANTYSGGTTINGGTVLVSSNANLGDAAGSLALNDGTLQTTASFTMARSATLNGVGTFNTSTGTTLVDNGAVSGSGALLKDGAGTLQLCGDVSHSGGTSVGAGRLDLCGNYTGSGAINVAGGTTLGVTGTTSLASSSGVSNSGTVDISGTTAGTSAQDISGSGDIVLGARTLTLNNAVGTISGTISGNGGALAIAGGASTLAGTNTYTGATSINGGASLALSGSGSIAASSGVATDGTLSIGGTTSGASIKSLSGNGSVLLGSKNLTLTNASGTFAGVIAGSGGLNITGGTEVLSGASTYTGGTSISNGATVEVSADQNLGDAAGSLVLNSGTLQTTSSFTTTRNTVLTGNGTFATDAATTLIDNGSVSGIGALVKDGAGTLQLCGDVSNSGGATVNAGRLDLCGNYTATGAISVGSGATLALLDSTSIGSASGLTSNGTFDISNTLLGATIQSLNGSGNVLLGNQNLTLSNASGNFGGVIAGSGGVTVSGGTQTLDGANTYTGATSIDSGATLALTGSGQAGAGSSMVNNGAFDISGKTGSATLANMVGAGSVALGGNDLTLTNASGNFDGSISGTGGLGVTGGVATLGGTSTYTGGTTIGSGATVRVSADANLGGASGVVRLDGGTLQTTASFSTARDMAVTGNGTLTANSGTTLNASGDLSGTGTLVKNGAGTINMSGDLAHAGGTVVNQGSLQLSGNNTYGGNTTLNGGTLKVASDSNLGGLASNIIFNGGALQATASFSSDRNVTASGAGTVSTDSGATLTLNGSISGAGMLTKTGTGTLVLSGDSSGTHTPGSGWTGGMTVESGLVQVTNAWGLGWGDVTVNGGTVNTTVDVLTGQTIALAGGTTVNVDAATTTTLSGTITDAGVGSGCFVKSGTGTLNLTGSMTQSNGTCVQQGQLRANGDLVSTVVVDTDGTLRGTGNIVGTTTVQGTLAPGNSPGTLTSVGTVTMLPGSTFQEDINGLGTGAGPGNYSRLLVVGAGNQFVAGGATLAPNLTAIVGAVVYTPYVPNMGDRFRIITAEGGIVGRFAPLAQPDGLASGTRMAAYYNVFGSNSIDLAILPDSYERFLSGGNANARSVGAALDRIVNIDQQGNATTAQSQLAYSVSGLQANQINGMFTALSGEVHAAMAAVAPLSGSWAQAAVGRQIGNDLNETSGRRALWVEVGGDQSRWAADTTASGFSTSRTLFALGGDLYEAGGLRLGAGFMNAKSKVSSERGTGSVEENLLFMYGQYRLGAYSIDGVAGYGMNKYDTSRADPLGLSGDLKTELDGSNAMAGLTVRRSFDYGNVVIEPNARVLFQRTTRDAGSEGNATPAALQLDRYSANGIRTALGAMIGSAQRNPLMTRYTYQLNVGVGMDSGDALRPVLQSSLADTQTTIQAPQVGRTFGEVGAFGTMQVSPQAYVYMGINGEARSGKIGYGANAGLRVSF